jgi:DNA (cytosine-5)-methyltransferase 1
MNPRIVSLCSGYGGLDLAVEQAFGAVTVAHCEWEAAPSLVLAHRWPSVSNLHDVKTADWSTINAEILTAGYPCQPFSHAGQRKGTDDERHLWPHVAEAIRRVRPKARRPGKRGRTSVYGVW